MKRSFQQYLSIQKYFYGDYYPLTEYSQAADAWMAYQVDLPEKGEGMVVVLKRPLSNYDQAVFPLRGLLPGASYEVINLDTRKGRTASGRELAGKGVEVSLLSKPDSTLITYRRKS